MKIYFYKNYKLVATQYLDILVETENFVCFIKAERLGFLRKMSWIVLIDSMILAEHANVLLFYTVTNLLVYW